MKARGLICITYSLISAVFIAACTEGGTPLPVPTPTATLTLNVESSILLNTTRPITVTLVNASGVSNLPIAFNVSESNVLALNAESCTIESSDVPDNSCSITLRAESVANSVRLIAAAIESGYNNLAVNVNVINESWTIIGQEVMLDGSAVNALDIYANSIYAGTSLGDVYYANTDGLDMWRWLNGESLPGDTKVTSMTMDSQGKIYAGTFDGYVYSNESNTWVALTGESVPDHDTVYGTVVDNLHNVYAASYGGDLYKTSASGGTWSVLGSGSVPDGDHILSVALDESGDKVYVGTRTMFSGGSVYTTSATSGGYWSDAGGGNIPDNGIGKTVVIDSTGHVCVGTDQGDVYRDENNSWVQLGGSAVPDSGSVNSLTIDSIDNLYAVTSNGNVYTLNINSGSQWLLIGQTVPDSGSILSSGLNASGDSLYVGTGIGNIGSESQGSVYKLHL